MSKVIDAIMSESWAITSDGLNQIVAIAERANDPEAVRQFQGQPLSPKSSVRVIDDTAILAVRGPIFRYANLFTQISGATSIEMLAKDFRQAVDSVGMQGGFRLNRRAKGQWVMSSPLLLCLSFCHERSDSRSGR